jgi:hypothetical protein
VVVLVAALVVALMVVVPTTFAVQDRSVQQTMLPSQRTQILPASQYRPLLQHWVPTGLQLLPQQLEPPGHDPLGQQTRPGVMQYPYEQHRSDAGQHPPKFEQYPYPGAQVCRLDKASRTAWALLLAPDSKIFGSAHPGVICSSSLVSIRVSPFSLDPSNARARVARPGI